MPQLWTFKIFHQFIKEPLVSVFFKEPKWFFHENTGKELKFCTSRLLLYLLEEQWMLPSLLLGFTQSWELSLTSFDCVNKPVTNRFNQLPSLVKPWDFTRGPWLGVRECVLEEYTTPTSTPSTGCLFWLSCGWTSTELI